MLSKKTPDTIQGDLKITAMGVENRLLLTYWNRNPDDYTAFVQNPENLKVPDEYKANESKAISFINAQLCLYLVKSFDDGTDKEFPLDVNGLMELDHYWPGVLAGIIRGYHMARAANVEKNSARR